MKLVVAKSDPHLVRHDDGYSRLVLTVMASMCDGLNASLQVGLSTSVSHVCRLCGLTVATIDTI